MKWTLAFFVVAVLSFLLMEPPKFQVQLDNHVLAVGAPNTLITKRDIEQIVDERIEQWHQTHQTEEKSPDRPLGVSPVQSPF